MKKLLLCISLLTLSLTSGADETHSDKSKYSIHLELDQMLCLKLGAEYRLSGSWGIKGAAGISSSPNWPLNGHSGTNDQTR